MPQSQSQVSLEFSVSATNSFNTVIEPEIESTTSTNAPGARIVAKSYAKIDLVAEITTEDLAVSEVSTTAESSVETTVPVSRTQISLEG
jgi:hypothetical protein